MSEQVEQVEYLRHKSHNFNGAHAGVTFKHSISTTPVRDIQPSIVERLCTHGRCEKVTLERVKQEEAFPSVITLDGSLGFDDAHAALDAWYARAKEAIGAYPVQMAIGVHRLPGTASCPDCGKVFGPAKNSIDELMTAEARLSGHRLTHAKDAKKAAEGGPASGEEAKPKSKGKKKDASEGATPFKCRVCAARFGSTAELTEHMEEHAPVGSK